MAPAMTARRRGWRRWPAVAAVFVVTAALALALTSWREAGSGGSTLPQPRADAAGTAAHDHAEHDHAEHDHAEHDHAEHGHDISAHEASEGFVLVASEDSSAADGPGCRADDSIREYALVAIALEITLNRYLDYDPDGRMYVLEEELPSARAEAAANAEARATGSDPAVSIGLQGDAIQPLAIRVNAGECLRLRLRNELSEPASIHLHGAALVVANDGGPAIATNPEAIAAPGDSRVYEWRVDASEPEGTHYFHSEGDLRAQTSHGLFGAVIVEPAGSTYLDPLTGVELRSGWSAMIRLADGSSFREAAIFYHEIGDESFQLRNADDEFVPQVDAYSGSYRPSSRALNYRSESFFNRMQLQDDRTGFFDESAAYSSYSFGDPATPIFRAYLGDPVKQRVIHAGSEVFHVHHVHGGSIRWSRQPGLEPDAFGEGPEKEPPLIPQASERVDSQTLGPSEAFDLQSECGSGGCQQSAGDYLFHCHVAQHYLSGMWGIWRTYNTLQDGHVSTDTLPPLLELPDREGLVAPAVTSTELLDTAVDWAGTPLAVTSETLPGLAEAQLPPSGRRGEQDASVFDWTREGTLYLNEPETTAEWPGYRSATPGQRPPLLFDPRTARLAFPSLRPHLAQRPPFAPGHGPAPFLDPNSGPDPPLPGAAGPASVCPAGTNLKEFVIHAITLPITLSEREGIVDPRGMLFVLKEQEAQVRADNGMRVPLAIRANAGEDCIDVILKSELEDNADSHFFSKVNAHIHFVQFDVQASDGVPTGFAYEQSVRPFAVEGERLTDPARAGDTLIRLGDADRFHPGVLVGVGMDQNETFEIVEIAGIRGDELVLAAPLRHPHAPDEIVSTEFVRYRWYPDVQFGTAYLHDHVNALVTWRHGLFGALIVEPPGSTYHDPTSGEQLLSGAIADIRTDAPLTRDLAGSFRELVLFIQDENPLTHVGRSTGSAFNLRVEPLDRRGGDPAEYFSSAVHGDPETPVLRAYLGDPIMIRSLVAATNDVHTLHVDGHTFRIELYSDTSRPVSTAHIGISERFDLLVPAAGGVQQRPGDYLYYNGRALKLAEGSWGLIRVLESGSDPALQPLPGRDPPAAAAGGAGICPPEAPRREFEIAAIDAPLPMLDRGGRLYVLERDREAALDGTLPPSPLVLHVGVGDCVTLELTNHLADDDASLHADMLAYDPLDATGIAVGRNPGSALAPGETRRFTYFAHPEIGETTALLLDRADVTSGPGEGLYGAIVVGPPGASYFDPLDGQDLGAESAWVVNVVPVEGDPYRDFTLFLQDDDATIGTHRMPYLAGVGGVSALNYQHEPIADRLDSNPDTALVFRSDVHGDPSTPVLDAVVGDDVRIHVLVPWSEQAQVFSVEGHRWPFEPGRAGTNLLSAVTIGGLEAVTLHLDGGAGGTAGLVGDFIYGDHREPYREAGLWGLFRVRPGDDRGPLLDLSCPETECVGTDIVPWRPLTLAAAALLVLAVFLASFRYRSTVARMFHRVGRS
jgi:FtsP/CotA-like multicopper oxidase with cupredoxin domain